MNNKQKKKVMVYWQYDSSICTGFNGYYKKCKECKCCKF